MAGPEHDKVTVAPERRSRRIRRQRTLLASGRLMRKYGHLLTQPGDPRRRPPCYSRRMNSNAQPTQRCSGQQMVPARVRTLGTTAHLHTRLRSLRPIGRGWLRGRGGAVWRHPRQEPVQILRSHRAHYRGHAHSVMQDDAMSDHVEFHRAPGGTGHTR